VSLSLKHKLILLSIAVCLLYLDTHVSQAGELSASEKECGARMVYREARGESKKDWSRVMSVAVNRKKNPKKYGARSSHLCDIVKSKQFTTAKKLNGKVKEPKRLGEIRKHLARGGWKKAGGYTHFNSKHGVISYESR